MGWRRGSGRGQGGEKESGEETMREWDGQGAIRNESRIKREVELTGWSVSHVTQRKTSVYFWLPLLRSTLAPD